MLYNSDKCNDYEAMEQVENIPFPSEFSEVRNDILGDAPEQSENNQKCYSGKEENRTQTFQLTGLSTLKGGKHIDTQLQINASKNELKAINAAHRKTTLQLSDGTRFKVIKYVPPEGQTDFNKENVYTSSNPCVDVKKGKEEMGNIQPSSSTQKYKMLVNKNGQETIKEQSSFTLKWLSKEETMTRQKEYKLRYINNSNGLQNKSTFNVKSK